MKRIAPYIVVCCMCFCAFGCRPQGDDLLSYGQNDYQAYFEANSTFAGEFKAFWTALNENYGIWDYEASFGTDWDEVYRTYLPRFEALDERQEKVTDKELEALYRAFTDTLHDGHLSLYVKNLHTSQYIRLRPNVNRLKRERLQEMQEVSANVTDLHAYRVAGSTYQVKEYDETGSSTLALEWIDSTLTHSIEAADTYLALVQSSGGPNGTNDSVYEAAGRLKAEAEVLVNALRALTPAQKIQSKSSFCTRYEKICTTYGFVGRQIGLALVPIEDDLVNDLLEYITYALFDGNIVYLRVGGFGLTTYLYPAYQTKDSATTTFAYQESVQRVWQRWFNAIQALHESGELGGVIIDVRNNSGGYVHDYQYALGALLPSGGWSSHTLRMKDGVGRLDFGPLTPFNVRTYEGAHAVVNERPIVVLANCMTVSMAENTTWGVHRQPNGCFIGTRTYGALSALNSKPEYYSDNYSGSFGVANTTPVYGTVPKYVCLFPDPDGVLRPVEGYGFAPDIEVGLDVGLWQSTGRDNQLEKALEYIKSR